MKGPSRTEEPVKAITRYDYGSKDVCKMKICKSNPMPTTYDEAKACCKARKRKERQESISSICQERKVIRSNSEERPSQRKHLEVKSAAMRRVSSSEDFQKSSSNSDKTGVPSLRQSQTDIILIYEECEYERRRSHERFSKPFALKNRKAHKSRRPKARCLPKPKFKPDIVHDVTKGQEAQTEEGSNTTDVLESQMANYLQLHAGEKERSPSPVHSANLAPDLDLSTLHEQVNCTEPLLSTANHQINENTETMPGLSVASNRLLSSPRNSIIATHRIYLDPDVPHGNFMEGEAQNPMEMRLQKINKQVNTTKKRIKKYEVEFEAQNGHKLSHADKLNDKNIRALYAELNKLKKEQKQINNVCPSSGAEQEEGLKSSKNLQETLGEIEKKLMQKRENSKRTNLIEQMSIEELTEEKIAIQKALLYLESIHGRPNSKEDRNMARPLYDRYRTLKRLVTKTQGNVSCNELATIHEDEAMHFSTSFPAQVADVCSEKSSVHASTDSSDTDTSISENLHSLSKPELKEQHRLASEEKKELRRTIKTFELEFQQRTGRMIQKEDKAALEHVYVAYKKVKATVKLLDALVGKQL